MNQVTICNLALAHLAGKSKLVSLEAESSDKELYFARLVWDLSVEETLRDHWWGFATKHQALASVGDPPEDWAYRYAYPSDCIEARYIVKSEAELPIAFEVALGDDEATRVLLTDREAATLCYTARVTNTSAMSVPFVTALAWRIASNIALPLTGDPELQKWASQMYMAQLNRSAALDSNERHERLDHTVDWLSARA